MWETGRVSWEPGVQPKNVSPTSRSKRPTHREYWTSGRTEPASEQGMEFIRSAPRPACTRTEERASKRGTL